MVPWVLIKAGKSWRRSISFILLAGCCGEQSEAHIAAVLFVSEGGKLLIGKKKKKSFGTLQVPERQRDFMKKLVSRLYIPQ